MDSKLFSVIKFLSDSTVEFVPTKWIKNVDDKQLVRFPYNKNPKTVALQKGSQSNPVDCWPEWEVEVRKSYDSVEKAESKVKKYLYTSDSSETDPIIKKRRFQPTLTLVNEDQPASVPLHSLHNVALTANVNDSTVTGGTTATSVFQSHYPIVVEELLPTANSQMILAQASCCQGEALQLLLNEQREFQIKSLENQEILIREQREAKTLLLKLLCKEKEAAGSKTDLPDDFFSVFPIRCASDLNRLDAELVEPLKFQKLVNALEGFGRTEVSQTTYDILSYLFEVNFSKTVRYTALSGKIAFRGRKLEDAVKAAVKANHLNSKEKQTVDSISVWFRGSSDRGGGRKSRNGNSKKKSYSTSTGSGQENSIEDSQASTSSTLV